MLDRILKLNVLPKQLTAFSRQAFFAKPSILDVWQVFEDASHENVGELKAQQLGVDQVLLIYATKKSNYFVWSIKTMFNYLQRY